jgi:hypothetical protein
VKKTRSQWPRRQDTDPRRGAVLCARTFDSADAADALAIAITYAHSALAVSSRARMRGRYDDELTGRLDSVSPNTVIVDAGGVGYEVTIGARTFAALPPPGESVTLAIDTHVRGRDQPTVLPAS